MSTVIGSDGMEKPDRGPKISASYGPGRRSVLAAVPAGAERPSHQRREVVR